MSDSVDLDLSWFSTNNFEPVTVKESLPFIFRMAIGPDGERYIQGGYRVTKGHTVWIEWERLPEVHVDKNGKEINTNE